MTKSIWCNTQWPAKVEGRINKPVMVYGQIFVDDITTKIETHSDEVIEAALFYGPEGTHPVTDRELWHCAPGQFVGHRGPNNHNFEFSASMTLQQEGRYWYAFRYFVKSLHSYHWGYVDGSKDDAPILGLLHVSESLRVGTINLFGFSGPTQCSHVGHFEERVEIIASEIIENHLDIVGLQEVCVSPGTDQASALNLLIQHLERFSLEKWFSFYAESHWAWGKYREGVALVARIPMEIVDAFSLPADENLSPRKLLMARFSTGFGAITVATTHLTFIDSVQGETSRCREVAAIRKGVEDFSVGSRATLVVGDFNASLNAPCLKLMTDSSVTGLRFFDPLGNLEPSPTFPSWNPSQRFDYLFLNTQSELSVCDGRRMLSECRQGKFASDHLGVFAVLTEKNSASHPR